MQIACGHNVPRATLPHPLTRVDMVTEYAAVAVGSDASAGSGRIHLITICFVKLTMERTERMTSAIPLPLPLALPLAFTRLTVLPV